MFGSSVTASGEVVGDRLLDGVEVDPADGDRDELAARCEDCVAHRLGRRVLPVPVIRRERSSRPAMTSGSSMSPSFAGMTQIRFVGRGLVTASQPPPGAPAPHRVAIVPRVDQGFAAPPGHNSPMAREHHRPRTPSIGDQPTRFEKGPAMQRRIILLLAVCAFAAAAIAAAGAAASQH